MVKLPKIFKKPWDKEPCTFVVQEYGLGTERGWVDVTEPSGQCPTKKECMDLFKPGKHYRVMARFISGDKAGQLAGVVWKHYEPLPGGLKPKKTEVRVRRKKEEEPMDIVTAMDKYAEHLGRTLEPLGKLIEALTTIRENLFQVSSAPSEASEQPRQVGYEIPPLEFDGKAPWMLHPYVVHTIAEEAKSVIAYGADRLEGIIGKRGMPQEVVEEEEKPLLPPLSKYAPEEEVEEVPVEEEMPIEEVEEIPEEVPPEEEEKPLMTVPSLIEEERRRLKEAEAEALGEEEVEEVVEEAKVKEPVKKKGKRGKKVESEKSEEETSES